MMWFLALAFAQETVEEPVALGPDRSHAPAVADPMPVDLDGLTVVEIHPGLRLHHVRVPNVQDVAIQVRWAQGIEALAAAGRARPAIRLTSALWGTATASWDEAALAALEDTLDLEIGTRIGPYASTVELEVPLSSLEQGWSVLDDIVLHPVFDKRILARTQENIGRYYLVNGPTDPGTIVSEVIDFAWYSPSHPLGARPDVAGYMHTSPKALPAVHDALLELGPVDIVVVGDLALEEVEAQVRKRFGALGVPGDRAKEAPDQPPTGTSVFAIALPDSEQISIYHRRSAPAYQDERRVVMSLITYALGGHFLARFNRNLREDKGWTYGVGAWYNPRQNHGIYNIAVDVPADKFYGAVTEIRHELDRVVQSGITQEEIDAHWRSSMRSYNDTRSTTSRASTVYNALVRRERTMEDRLEQLDASRAVTSEQTRDLAKALFDGEKGVWVFLGPRDGLEAGLKELGMTAQWVLPEDAMVGRL